MNTTATGPVILIDDDEDDLYLIQPLLEAAAPNRPVLVFTSGEEAIDFLRTSDQRPFLIISEVSLHRMNGLELRRQIEEDAVLKKRAIPFIFLTYPAYRHIVEEAYELTIQGFFEKQPDMNALSQQLRAIVDYWTNCLHPNRFEPEKN